MDPMNPENPVDVREPAAVVREFWARMQARDWTGCAYCMRLRIRLGRKARRLHWVDIWQDEAGAELVREANGGDETVPTLLVAGRAYTNPDPAWVREQVSSPR